MNTCTSNVKWLLAVLMLAWAQVISPSFADSPFGVNAILEPAKDAQVLHVSFSIPDSYYLYADQLSLIPPAGITVEPLDVTSPVKHYDKLTGDSRDVYNADFKSTYRISGPFDVLPITVNFQGCSEQMCFFPESKMFVFTNQTAKGTRPVPETVVKPTGDTTERSVDLKGFKMVTVAGGYLGASDFIAFIDRAEGKGGEVERSNGLFRYGLVAGIVLVFLGGMGLNLTPCVLPLIPVNLAIIGAGIHSGSKKQGLLRGAIYGLGMALAYGVLGVFVVVTGAKFGALNASPWFNLGITVVFLLLSVAMFDWVTIDFSRYQRSQSNDHDRQASFLFPFTMGVVAALLAGACVAPVVISVLLLSANLYAQGYVIGLVFPFLLGMGMGTPWALAGAGLSFLPKPGPWMVRVKHGFGILILILAAYYGNLSWNLFRNRPFLRSGKMTVAEAGTMAKAENKKLLDNLDRARREGQPVFIDFWASWCKNCEAMEITTFKDPNVQERLAPYIVVRYQAEVPDMPSTTEILDLFQVYGLPSYVVLIPNRE